MKLCKATLLGVAALTSPVFADTSLSLALELGSSGSVISAVYDCGDGDDIEVQYINDEANALALIEVDNEDRIFVNVIAASGSRYVSGAFVWWSKGETATFEDQMTDGSMKTCKKK